MRFPDLRLKPALMGGASLAVIALAVVVTRETQSPLDAVAPVSAPVSAPRPAEPQAAGDGASSVPATAELRDDRLDAVDNVIDVRFVGRTTPR